MKRPLLFFYLFLFLANVINASEISFETPFESFKWFKALNKKALDLNSSGNEKEIEKFEALLNEYENTTFKNASHNTTHKIDLSVTRYFLKAKNPLDSFQYEVQKLSKGAYDFDKIYSLIESSFSLEELFNMAQVNYAQRGGDNITQTVKLYVKSEIDKHCVDVYTLIDKSINKNEIVALMFVSPHGVDRKIIFFVCRKPNYSHLLLGFRLLSYLKENRFGKYILTALRDSPLPTLYEKFGFQEDKGLHRIYRHLFPKQLFMSGILGE